MKSPDLQKRKRICTNPKKSNTNPVQKNESTTNKRHVRGAIPLPRHKETHLYFFENTNHILCCLAPLT